MKFDLHSRVALAEDLPERRLRRGDVVTIVDHHSDRPGQEPGYSLEVFNAVGETVDVVTVRESQIEPLTADRSGLTRRRRSILVTEFFHSTLN